MGARRVDQGLATGLRTSQNVGLQNALVISEVKCQNGSLRIGNIHSEI